MKSGTEEYKLSQYIFRNPKYPKANAAYLSKMLRQELEKLPTKNQNEFSCQVPIRQSRNFQGYMRKPLIYAQSRQKRRKSKFYF